MYKTPYSLNIYIFISPVQISIHISVNLHLNLQFNHEFLLYIFNGRMIVYLLQRMIHFSSKNSSGRSEKQQHKREKLTQMKRSFIMDVFRWSQCLST